MTLKRRLMKIERVVNPRAPSFTVLFEDEAGTLRDTEGNVITGQLCGKVIVFSESIRDV